MDFILNKGAELFQHNRNLEPSFNSLKRKLGELNCVKEDVESKMKNELHPGKKLKKQVENWFENVGMINSEVENLEQDLRSSNFLSSGSLAEKVSWTKDEVEGLIQRGSFSDGLVIYDPSQTGILWDTAGFMGEGMEKTLNDIWELLMDNKVETIGVHGMGGVGKTTIVKQLTNRLQQEARRRVIWVTASKDQFDIFRLQAGIADEFNVPLREGKDKTIRARELFSVLSKQEGYVLILDDLWDKISLNDVGIPRPLSNRSKIVVTSRSRDVLQYLDCEIVKVEPLKEDMSWKLFLEKVDKSILEHPDLIPVAKSVAKECGGLPLAIVTVASSMKGEYEVGEWKNALKELREHLNSIKGIDGDIMQMLQFSYDHLKDPEIQQCFLSCALYPEDAAIYKEELINYWIEEGMIQEMERRSDQIDRCNSIINKLKSNCLLEGDHIHYISVQYYYSVNHITVKMHDLVRDMAVHITRTGPRRFFIQAGMHMKKMPSNAEFGENVEKVSLMRNRIEFGDYWKPSSPGCLMLTTLLLQENKIGWIPECFFEGMPNLMFLNLSRNPFRNLPESLSDLKNLTSLILWWCQYLENVPCLSKLQRLKQLDLRGTRLRRLPVGMEELVNLKYLHLCVIPIGRFPDIPGGILGKLCSLQYLGVDEFIRIGKEVANLKRLEYIEARFGDVSDLNTFVESRGGEFLPNYNIVVCERPYSMGDMLPITRSSIELSGIDPNRELIQLPSNVEKLTLHSVRGGKRSLNDCVSMTSLGEATDLRYLGISDCEDMECVFSEGYPQINNLSTLCLESLYKLTAVCSPCPSTCRLSSLARIHINRCHKLKELFSFDCLPPNLEEINVHHCDQMEEIVTWEEGSRIASGSSDTTQTQLLCLPKLKILQLRYLPQLKSIFPESGIFMASEALTKIEINECPLLRRVPLHLTPDSHLEEIDVRHCNQLEEIVTWEEGSRIASGSSDTTQTQLLCLPKLKILRLRNLPQLKSIFPESGIIMASDALEEIDVHNCPLLRRVPLHLTPDSHLEEIDVCDCDQMEEIVTWEEGSRIASGSSDTTQTQLLCLPKLKKLMLSNLPQLKSIFPESGIFMASEALTKIEINECPLLRRVPLHLTPDSHLEVIDVRDCNQLEEIVTWEEGSRIASGSSDTTQTQLLCLPKLKELQLINLPQLKSIFPESGIIMASDALEQIQVNNCPLLRRVPLHLPLLPDGQPSAPPYLQQVRIHPPEWWHSSDWGHPNAKAVLRPFLRDAFLQRPWELLKLCETSTATSSFVQMLRDAAPQP